MAASAAAILKAVSELLRPPRRMPVAEAAGRYLRIARPGGVAKEWDASLTPYMVEPMNALADRRAEAVVFVGPARTGKTFALVIGGLTYSVICDPGDTLVVHMTEHNARDFSKDDIARAHRNSPELQARLSPYASDDNVFDKAYRNGMRLLIGWPSVRQLSSRTLRNVLITDYDRISDNIDGEGSAFELARKRVQTFLSASMVLVESSPGRVITDPKWRMIDPHEGPPCTGIFGLYNQGTRKRWYWPCPECGEYFTAQPTVDALAMVDGEVGLPCPHCGAVIQKTAKRNMNLAGRWLAAGQTIDRDGVISGNPPPSSIQSYWLTGPAAAYQSWTSLWRKYHAALDAMERTGAEDALQAVVTGDFGMAYRPRNLSVTRESTALSCRAEEWEKRTVPDGVMYLIATVDVQGNRFVVQVIGYGRQKERWLIDRYNLKWSPSRVDTLNAKEPIDPARYIEDWAALNTVITHPYPFSSDPNRALLPVCVGIDSGGKAGATEKAYDYWRQCRKDGNGKKVRLVKGDPRQSIPRIVVTYPDNTKRSTRKANAKGEIPVHLINATIMKDALAADLSRDEAGPGYIHFPRWIGDWFFDELTNEVRTAKGWDKTGRNEAIDLFVYADALNVLLKGEAINWESPPAWANPELSALLLVSVSTTQPTTAHSPPTASPNRSGIRRQSVTRRTTL